ncbi:FG-GAP-like repeat-containing protein [Streptomyces flavotricini]|uniref:FG-GAP-like repeat-containing protein n=1 Tax=Streptomyces flavotricini TaxID=66888 RepID=A0ABS8EAB5_9ACTN|nr:FG-GAP-like repeat-containing protein [Streptomyces flavotricini]MCC0097659.1 FG-GAP-like repeat-containing protein [Streptomyces flavotricini]
MSRTLTTLAMAAALAAGAALPAAAPAAAADNPAPPVLRVMPLGDSITDGYQSSTNAGYRLQLWQKSQTNSRFRVDFVGSRQSGAAPDSDNEAHGATMINDFRGKVTDWVRAAEPDVVLLHHGVNDLDRGTDKAEAPARLAAVTDEILAARPGVTVVVMGLIPISGPPGVSAFNTTVKNWVSAKAQAGAKVRYVDAPALVRGEMVDGLHPTDAGYRKMGDAFFDGIDRAVAEGTAVRTHKGRAGTESGGADRLRWADWDGDGRADRVLVEANGSVHVLLNRGGDGRGGWEDLGQIATGLTTDRRRVRFADWDGDGRADYILISETGSVTVYLNRGGDGHGGWGLADKVAVGLTRDTGQVRFVDFDGDGRTDYAWVRPEGPVTVYLNKGGDGRGGWQERGTIATGVTPDPTRVRWTDFDGDAYADYSAVRADGSVETYLNRGGDGHGGWSVPGAPVTAGTTTDHRLVAFADFDGDGHSDYILTAADGSTSVRVWNGGDAAGGWTDLGTVAGTA